MRGVDLNPYRSPQVDPAPPAPPAHVWTPNYRSAAFTSAGLVIVGCVLVYSARRFAIEYAKDSPLEVENVAMLAVLALVVASFARLLWRALKYGERA